MATKQLILTLDDDGQAVGAVIPDDMSLAVAGSGCMILMATIARMSDTGFEKAIEILAAGALECYVERSDHG